MFIPCKEKGQGIIELALLLVLVAMVVILALDLMGVSIGDIFSNIITNLEDVTGESSGVFPDRFLFSFALSMKMPLHMFSVG